MWKLGILLLIPAVFGGLQQQEISLEGCLLPDGRFFAVGEKWDIKTGGVSCGAYCTCQGINAFGCVGCPLVRERPPVAPPLKFQKERREKREIESQCEYNGQTYNQGESFPSADGCNRCFCAGQMVGCTMRACIQGCYWNGSIFKVGEIFHNGCGVCRCKPRNKIDCTVDSCLPNLGQQESQREQSPQRHQSTDDLQFDSDIPAL